MAITKTGFMRRMQCPKMLWLDRHKPSLKVIPPEVQERLDAGNDFGDKAMTMFGPYEEMTIYLPGTTIPDKKAMVTRTKEHFDIGTNVICEAAFMYYNNYCAVDILKKTDAGYDKYEVKNSPELHEQFIKDIAFQYYIINHCHIRIGKIFVVLHGENEDGPFVQIEVTEEVKKLYNWVDNNIWRLNRIQKETEELDTEPGTQCSDPYECWYYGYCHNQPKEEEKPDEQAEQLTLL